MRSKLSAIIIDPNYYQHEYLNLKSPDYGEYAERYFEIKILESDKDILEKIYDFNYFDTLISIGDINQYTELFKLPFEYRKKWCHYDIFDIEKISDAIISTFSYNIDREDIPTTFSFFTCTYNTPKDKLKRLYESFIRQTYKEWNWFIIDDSPNDNTINLINSLKDPRITIIKNVTRHGNIGFNKHTIAMMCNGDYLVEIDHDDEITDDCLHQLKSAFDKYPDAGFAYSLCLEYSVGKDSMIPIVYSEGWGWGEGQFKAENVKGEDVYFSASPNINSYSIRTIYAQPNHVRCWKKELYHQICGHNTELSVLDDMELIIRTFLHTKMIKIDKVLYIQYEDSGERGSKENNNTQSARFGEIQRTTWILKNKYDKQIHDRIIELGFKDDPWDETQQCSILWKEHTPNQEIMNYIYNP